MKLIQIEEQIGSNSYKGPSNFFINFEGKTKVRLKGAQNGAYSQAKNIERKLEVGAVVQVKFDWPTGPAGPWTGHVVEVS